MLDDEAPLGELLPLGASFRFVDACALDVDGSYQETKGNAKTVKVGHIVGDRLLECALALLMVFGTAPATDRQEDFATVGATGYYEGS